MPIAYIGDIQAASPGRWAASCSSRRRAGPRSGRPIPVRASMRETLDWSTPRYSASFAWLQPRRSRRARTSIGVSMSPPYMPCAYTIVKAKCTDGPCDKHTMGSGAAEQATRLREARIAAGFTSARSAAERHSWVYETYIQHEQGIRGLTRAARKYARAFGVSEAWLLTGDGVGPGKSGAEAARLNAALVEISVNLTPERRANLLRYARDQLLAQGQELQRDLRGDGDAEG